ncbi:MAG: I78 family peptidase inhibitor [Pseudoxanthomonas sp.]
MHKFLTGCGLSLALTACAQSPGPIGTAPTPPANAAAQCDASKVLDVVGQLPTAALQQRARTAAGAQLVRLLRHDQIVTLEFRVERLNLVLDATGRISRVNCG